MTGKITVKRYDYPEKKKVLRSGKIRTTLAHSVSYYYWNGVEIAYQCSHNDRLCLNSKYLARGRDKSYFCRMKNSNHSTMWADLCEFLSVTDNTLFAEYFNV